MTSQDMTQTISQPGMTTNRPSKLTALKIIMVLNAIMLAALALILGIYPPLRAIWSMRDSALKEPGIPEAAWRLHRSLSPDYARWAEARLGSSRAAVLELNNISGTEWPLFGSVFYLWGTENLQRAWDNGVRTSKNEPRVYARDAITVACDLVLDPKQAAWVQKHWGTNFMARQNVFYRALRIAAMSSRENLLKEGTHLDSLKAETEALSEEIDQSPAGLLEDYPGQCYPGDVMCAILAIKRAGQTLGTNYDGFVTRSLRAFVGRTATPSGLPAFQATAATGQPVEPPRGSGNAYVGLTAPELWPAKAAEWFRLHDRAFWQENWLAHGYREYARKGKNTEWFIEVDAGPVLAGHGVSASAFGLGAARKNGRFDRANPLSLEMLAAAWETPWGTLLVPRLLSNAADAPLLGEAAILWNLTQLPAEGVRIQRGGKVPPLIYWALGIPLAAGLLTLYGSVSRIKEIWRGDPGELPPIPRAPLQVAAWALLMISATVLWFSGHGDWGLIPLAAALLLPRKGKPAMIIVDHVERPA
jgi:hypothetical protein